MPSFILPPSAPIQRPQGDLSASLFIGAIAGLFVYMLTAIFLFALFHYQPTPGLYTLIGHVAPDLPQYMQWPVYHWSTSFTLIFYVSGTVAGFTLLATVFYIYEHTTPPAEIHLAGRQLLHGRDALKAATAELEKEHAWGLPGLPIITTPSADELRISEDRETKHILFVGATGSGKTTTMRSLIDNARARGDRCIILDNKSDSTKTLPGTFGKDTVIIAPWDSRGHRLDIAADIQNRSDAIAFAEMIVPESKDPFWSNGARMILTAIVIRAQQESPGEWGFGFLAEVLRGGDREIKKTVEIYTPEYSPAVADMESKTTKGLVLSMLVSLKNVFQLADAWSRCNTPGAFSVRRWVHEIGDEKDFRTVILQGHGKHIALQKAVIEAVFKIAIRELTSPEITDVKPCDRRIWFFCDELVQFGKIPEIQTLIEIGRSKGVRVALGVQDVMQLQQIYGHEAPKILTSSINTWVIGKMQGADTAEWLSKAIGKHRVKVYSPSYSVGYETAGARSEQYTETERHVIRPDEFSSILGADSDGVKVVLHTGGTAAYVVQAVHLTDEQRREKRPPIQPARWTAAGWPALIDEVKKDLEDTKGGTEENDDE